MKKKRIIILALQIVIVLATAFMFLNYTQTEISPTQVYVYNTDIEDVSKPLTENDIKAITIPAKGVNNDFARDKGLIIGKHVDSKVKAGQHIYMSQLIETKDVDVFETIDLTKYRKISLPISFVEGFSGNIKRGDKVDLVYVGKGEKEVESNKGVTEKAEFIYSKVFLQDVLVYGVNTGDGFKFEDRSEKTGFTEAELDTEQSTDGMEVITLAVTLEQAEEINTRRSSGSISFVGRFDDSKSYDTLGYVLGDYEKIFSGQGFAETGIISVEEDTYEKKVSQ